jgi:DNA-binding transcriptional LysR family regulator
MIPTTTADQIYPDLKTALQILESHINNRHVFNPATSNFRFRLALTDLGEMVFLPTILNHLQKKAPNVELEVIPLQINNVCDWFNTGQVDGVICSCPLNTKSLERKTLVQGRYVCMARADTFRSGPIDLETFLKRKQIAISGSSGHNLIDSVLSQLNIERKVILEVSHFSILPNLLMSSGLMSVLPVQIANQFSDNYDLAVKSLPFDVPDFEVSLYGHTRANRSAAQEWFCETVLEAIRLMRIPELDMLATQRFNRASILSGV